MLHYLFSTTDDSMPSRITATLLGLAAEIERELISMRTTEALAKRRSGV
ncbi:MAG TPA: recombinase family protein [Coleofasciculaceae cyanobacterium]